LVFLYRFVGVLGFLVFEVVYKVAAYGGGA